MIKVHSFNNGVCSFAFRFRGFEKISVVPPLSLQHDGQPFQELHLGPSPHRSQIVLMQCIYYSFLGLWMAGVDSLVQSNRSLDQIFSYQVCPALNHVHHNTSSRQYTKRTIVALSKTVPLYLQVLGFATIQGRLSMMAFVLNSLTCALGLWFFIRRGKQCLDFTVTVHFFHMIGCWIYNAHLPAALSWWLVNVACMALMAVIGEYLCMQTELRAIPVNTGPKSNL
ncbi:Protein SYS1 [Merluccius polli]|uniref:Protein SYS1 n=1 Tax=Merluccius polli TaxID=89951 RepID=A0AA47MP57_MERPO|nr:Protein SYS1 [Merluccius polli]